MVGSVARALQVVTQTEAYSLLHCPLRIEEVMVKGVEDRRSRRDITRTLLACDWLHQSSSMTKQALLVLQLSWQGRRASVTVQNSDSQRYTE